uniref:Uncharacterized protein n=1 Tax=Anguilla anguilla TaxID=7936 RepID=A0A0E9T2S2_ANGAN
MEKVVPSGKFRTRQVSHRT